MTKKLLSLRLKDVIDLFSVYGPIIVILHGFNQNVDMFHNSTDVMSIFLCLGHCYYSLVLSFSEVSLHDYRWRLSLLGSCCSPCACTTAV